MFILKWLLLVLMGRNKTTLIGLLCSDETAVITEEVPNFLFLDVFPNWTMVYTLVAASRLTVG